MAALALNTLENRPRILVVEDSKTNRDLMQAILGKDYEVLLANNGKEGVSLAQKAQPDLILMDAVMPVMNGYDACSLLKSNPQTASIPVIFITARNTSEDELHGLEVGAIDYIMKPFSAPVVEMRVRNHLELKFYRDQLETMATMDGLTNIANRRRFNEVIMQEWSRCRRDKQPLSLCLIDIDHFKAYNDHYGHLKGDDALKSVAKALKNCISRPGDLVARYGGEEFACILPNTDLESAQLVAARLQKSIYELFIPHERSTSAITLSVSIGVASYQPDSRKNIQDLIDCSDQNLYKAKQLGRNQIAASELV